MKKIGILPVSDNIEGLILSRVSHNTTADSVLNSLLPATLTAAGTPLLAWALLVFYGTFSRSSILQPLSIRKSLVELTSARNARLDVLDVIRVIAILWVMINHTGSEGRIDVLERLPSAHIFKVYLIYFPQSCYLKLCEALYLLNGFEMEGGILGVRCQNLQKIDVD